MRFSPGEIIRIPSPIDVHAHLREPGGVARETIETGTLAALAGGYQAVFDMPNNPGGKETWTEARLDEKSAITRRSANTNIGFYAGVDLSDPAFGEMPALVRKSAGLKLYMGHTTGNTAEHTLDSVRDVIDEWIRSSREYGLYPTILLHALEGAGAETADYIASRGHPAHWCHISTTTEVALATQLTKKYPDNYTGGVTPHHLTMTQRNADFQQGWNGARMQPALGGEIDADALLDAYNRGDLQILETDHAPHLTTDKLKAESENPEGSTGVGDTTCFGVSGIEFVLPVMASLIQRRKTTLERVVDSLYAKPLKMLGIHAAAGTAGNRTTLEIGPYVLSPEDIAGQSSNTPYVGWTAWARVREVALSGRTYEARTGFGREISKSARILKTGSEL